MSIVYNYGEKQHMKTKFHLIMDIAGTTQDLTEKIISAKMIQEESIFPDSVPISTLEVVINDPEGVYDITKNGGLVEIAEVNQKATASVDMTPLYFVRSNRMYEWVTGNTQNFDMGEWYFNKSSYKNNTLIMQFYDESGMNDKLLMTEAAPIHFYTYNSGNSGVIASSGGAIPYDYGITKRDFAKYQLYPYPVSKYTLSRLCTRSSSGRRPLTEQPSIELKQKITGVTIQGRRFRAQYDQSDIKQHQYWAEYIDYSTGDMPYYNSLHIPLNGNLGSDGYYEETLNISKSQFTRSRYDDTTFRFHTILKLNRTYLPYTFKIYAMNDNSIVKTLDYMTSAMLPDKIAVDFYESEEDVEDESNDFNCIKIRAVPADMLVYETLIPGTYTRTFPDKFINDSVEVFNKYAEYKPGITIVSARQHSLTFSVAESCTVMIGQQQLIEERIEVTAVDEESAAILAENTRTLYNPSMDGTISQYGLEIDAEKCLSLLNQYPYSIKLKLYPQITDQSTYNTSLGEFSPNVTDSYCNFFDAKSYAMKPNSIFGYIPGVKESGGRTFNIWVERIETDLTGGCIRTISGSARAN